MYYNNIRLLKLYNIAKWYVFVTNIVRIKLCYSHLNICNNAISRLK